MNENDIFEYFKEDLIKNFKFKVNPEFFDNCKNQDEVGFKFNMIRLFCIDAKKWDLEDEDLFIKLCTRHFWLEYNYFEMSDQDIVPKYYKFETKKRVA